MQITDQIVWLVVYAVIIRSYAPETAANYADRAVQAFRQRF